MFLLKYRQLLHRGLTLIKNEIVSSLRTMTERIESQLQSNSKIDPLNTETAYYVQFRVVAPKVRPLCAELEKRASIKEYV